jgi:hypothetical protein
MEEALMMRDAPCSGRVSNLRWDAAMRVIILQVGRIDLG